MPPNSTKPGYVNKNNQEVVEDLGPENATDHCNHVIKMKCLDCDFSYGTNSSNCHQSLCPNPNGGGDRCGEGKHEDLLNNS